MKKILFKLLSILLIANSYAQDPQTNLKKYWKFRERLKNFVVSGDCIGCGVPAIRMEHQTGDPANFNTIRYDDSGIRVGMYVGMLAMEYKLLSDHGQDLTQVKKDLFYALETLNRVDRNAEPFWHDWDQTGYDPMNLNPTNTSLNGFFLRDDIKDASHFFNEQFENKRIIDHLTNSLFPLESKYVPRKVDSGFTTGVGQNVGPREESLDQVVDIYFGLALVKHLLQQLPNTEYPGHVFGDGQTNFVLEAKAIANRINSWMQLGSWKIHNPEHGGCVFGVCGPVNLSNQLCLVGACGGGDVTLLGYGFNQVNCFIQDGNCNTGDPELPPSQLLWETAFRWNIGVTDGDADKIITLAAIFNPWGDATNNNIAERGFAQLKEFVDLLHNIIHDQGQILSNEYYECLLNACTCDAPVTGYEWGVEDRFVYGPNTQWTGGDPTYLLDYLIYFNLYAISNPDYLNGITPYYYDPKNLAEVNRYLQNVNVADIGYNEITERNYLASNSVNAGASVIPGTTTPGDYIIDANGNVTMRAGNEINLEPGFNTINGGLLNAYIDQTISSLDCSPPQFTECTNFCTLNGNEEQQGSSYSTNNIKVYKFVENELFVSTGKYLFKIREDGGTGQNMFALNNTGGTISGLMGYNYYIGHQEFDASIVDVSYINGSTYISLSDGKMLHVSGTGGTGIINMFGVDEHSGGSNDAFSPHQFLPTSYLGDAKFDHGITAVRYIEPYLFIGLNNGVVLKVDPLTYPVTSHNMFYLQHNGNSTDFWDGSGSNQWYKGDAKFCSAITIIKEIPGSQMLVGSSDGWVVKVNGTGGFYENMFALDFDCSFWGNDLSIANGYTYSAGVQEFNNPLVKAEYMLGDLFLAFSGGKILRIIGTGGSGSNMFNIVETSGGFETPNNGYAVHRRGDDYFDGTVVDFINNETAQKMLIAFSDGRLLKVNNLGNSGGHEIFNVNNTDRGFEMDDWNYTQYFEGCMYFEGASITCMKQVGNNVFIGLDNGKLVKLAGYGGTGLNMYALADDNGTIKNLCNYHYLIGEQDFHDIGAGRFGYIEETKPNTINNVDFNIFPNPNTGIFKISLPAIEESAEIKATLTDITGRVVKRFGIILSKEVQVYSVDASSLSNGTYFLNLSMPTDKKVFTVTINK